MTQFSTVRAQQTPGGGRDLQKLAANMLEGMLQPLDPDLLKRAEEKGLYKRAEYPVLRTMNPFFMRGDFNGDGAMDVAVWVKQQSSGLTGVAVIHSTLDAVQYLGAGQGNTDMSGTGRLGEVSAEAWMVVPVGTIVRPSATVPEIAATRGQPFTFRHEGLQFHWLGKSSFAFYWANGRYWEVWTGD